MADITKAGTIFTPTFYQSAAVTVSPATRVDGGSLAVETPPTNAYLSELKAGEAIDVLDPCYIKAADGKVYRSKVSINAVPAAPTLTNTAGGVGLWNGGTVSVVATYLTAYGESTPSIPAIFTVTTTGSIHVATTGYTGLDASITGLNFYVNNVLMATQTVTAGSMTAAIDISGAALTLSGAAPPVRNTAFKDASFRVAGYAMLASASGEAVTLVENVEVSYGTTNYPSAGEWVYLSVNAGQIATAVAANATGQKPCGRAVAKPDPISSGTQKNLILWAVRE